MTGNSTIYNATDGPLIIDRAGRILGGRERLEDVDASASPVSGHVEAGRIIVIEDQAQAPAADDEQADADPDASSPAPGSRKARRSPAPTTEEA